MLNFAAEEAKHIQLFKRFHETFTEGFGIECEVIGPPEAVAKVVLGHEPLSVALFILMIEWMTQSHYVDSVRGDAELDPLFANLLRCHWIEEAQHAKLDTLMVEALAEGEARQQIHAAVDGMLAIAASSTPAASSRRSSTSMRWSGRSAAQARAMSRADRADRAAAPGAALDLSRLRHGPQEVPRDARRAVAGRARARSTRSPPNIAEFQPQGE